MRPPLLLWSAAAGAAWGGLALLLGGKAFGAAIWSGVLASPVIGAATGHLIHPRFEGSAGVRRWLWAVGSLYLGAILFGLAIGAGEELARGGPGHQAGAALAESVLAVLWGVTATGFFLILAPLAYATHWLLEWRLG